MTTRPDRARRPGVATLDAGGGAAQWCRDVVRVTRPVHRVDAGLRAVCAAAPRRPRVATGPPLGATLPEVVERPVSEEPTPDDSAGQRRRRRAAAVARDLAGRDPEDCPSGTRPRPGRVEASDPSSPPGRTSRPPTCPPDRMDVVSQRPSAPLPGAGPRVTAARLRALAGSDVGARTPGLGRTPGWGGPVRRQPWPAPRTGSTTRERALARARPTTDLGTEVAARLARRVGAGGPDGLASLERAPVRATGPTPDLTAADLRALAATAAAPDAAPGAAENTGSGASGDAPRTHRRRRPAGEPSVGGRRAPSTTGTGVAAPDHLHTRGAPAEELAGLGPTPPPIQPDPPADAQGLRALTRYSELPATPPRLGGGPLSDDTEAARGLPWTGTAPVTPDVRAATTAVGLPEPDLELVMTRILDDVARRHGIEV